MKLLYLLFAGLAALFIGGIVYLIATTFQGTLGTVSIVFLVLGVLLTAGFVAINAKEVAKAIQGRSAYEGFNMFFGIAVALVLAVIVFLYLDRHNSTLDFTEAQKYTLAPFTYTLLDGLEEPIVFQYLMHPTALEVNAQAENLMRLYTENSEMVTYEMVDPQAEPERVAGISGPTYMSIYVRKGDIHEKVDALDENSLTNTLLKVSQGEQLKVYFTTGHGEPALDDTQSNEAIGLIAGMLRDEGYITEPIALFEMNEVPEDAAAIVVVGPSRPFIDSELETLKRYLDNGGDALFFVDPPALTQRATSGMEEFLFTNYGILLGENWVIENNPITQLVGAQPHTPIMSGINPHPITNAFAGSSQAIIFPIVRSVQSTDSAPDGVILTELITTSDMSWGETDLAEMAASGLVGNDADVDLQGPVPIALAATMDVESTDVAETAEEAEAQAEEMESDDTTGAEDLDVANQMRLVVFGDSDFITNANYLSTFDLFINSVNWLVEKEDMISIRAKDDTGTPILLTAVQANILFYIPIIVIPGLIAVLGGVVVFLRMRMT